MRVWVLGSGTLLPDPDRGSPGYWVEAGEEKILLDCGSGCLRTLARLRRPWSEVDRIFLTHLHTDHVGELAPLLFALRHGVTPPRSKPLWILGPQGLLDHLEGLAKAHGAYVADPGFPVEVVEVSPGTGWSPLSGAFHLRSFPTRHTEGSLAYRIESSTGTLGFTGDTGPTAGLGAFLRRCQVLVAECSNPDGTGMETHLTPGGLAALAQEAQPDLLLTVHAYPPLDPLAVPDLLARAGYTRPARAARDGMEVWVSGDVVQIQHAGL